MFVVVSARSLLQKKKKPSQLNNYVRTRFGTRCPIQTLMLTVQSRVVFVSTTPNWSACGVANPNATSQMTITNFIALDSFDMVWDLEEEIPLRVIQNRKQTSTGDSHLGQCLGFHGG